MRVIKLTAVLNKSKNIVLANGDILRVIEMSGENADMMRCFACGAVSRTRTSVRISERTQRNYHQCQNLLCGTCFTSLQEVEKVLTNSKPAEGAELPKELFHPNHLGEDQMGLDF
ncbi:MULTISPECIES: ogr/Delta-like zinc finger family protein [unclassified Serratia (in: enterobacteria)]|uniref:ogr/Delta-like zinc finger family protein n=1 Tax=unclassified Serratia (in: enterobacteria) TaxID=2647522 RepID=UPI0030764FAC